MKTMKRMKATRSTRSKFFRDGCGKRWQSPIDQLRHVCRWHTLTGLCVCPCAMRREEQRIREQQDPQISSHTFPPPAA